MLRALSGRYFAYFNRKNINGTKKLIISLKEKNYE
jgi:hypothetical protein